MKVTASAPGKLVLLGEYAVLEGGPALVMAVNRRARVLIAAKAGGVSEICAPEIGVEKASLQIGGNGEPVWLDAPPGFDQLRLVDEVLRGLFYNRLAPVPGDGFTVYLDTSDCFDTGATGTKLGLGSSAALVVALTSALMVFAGGGEAIVDRPAWLSELLRVHRAFQGGQGSGADVAAALIGGLISFHLPEQGVARPFEPAAWPPGVQARFVWTGRSASTSNFLDRLAQWRRGHSADYAAHLSIMTAIATDASSAVAQGRGPAFIDAVAAYADALRAFGVAADLAIFSPEHRRLAALAAQNGVSYKPCGAGGGDFGAAFAMDPEALARVERCFAAAGFRCMPLEMDVRGLTLACDG